MASTSPQHRPSDDTDLDLARRVIEPDLAHDAGHGDGDVGTQFDLNWRGYDRHQVDAYLRTWGEDYWSTKNERDALLAELDQLRAAPPMQLSPLSSMSARLQEIVTAAEEEAAALRHETREAADALLAEARAQAEAERGAAAAARAVAIGEADRMTREARETHDQVVGEAQALAERTTADADAEAARVLGEARAEARRLLDEATAEAADIRQIVAAEEEQILSSARAEADELARSTTRQRDIAEAEHQRLLTAHASQQRHFSEGLRREVAELQAEAERLTAEVERRRAQVAAGSTTRTGRPAADVPSAPLAPPPTRTPVSSTMLTPAEVAAAALDEIHALGEPSDEIQPLESFLHSGDTGEVFVDEEPPAPADRPGSRTAIDALRHGGDDGYADQALGLFADDDPTGETPLP